MDPRLYFGKLGLLDQDWNTRADSCRTIDKVYDSSNYSTLRPNLSYKCGRHDQAVMKGYYWWIMLLHTEEGSQLDNFISNSHWTQTSHKCHWAFCLVISHLEAVRAAENVDRTVCKNGLRARYGGCNSLQSLHPHDHCLIGAPRASGFEKVIYYDPQAPKLRRASKRLAARKGRCEECRVKKPRGRQVGVFWRKDPTDSAISLCHNCYRARWARRDRAKKAAGL